MSIDGEGFTSIQYQNANNSVRVTDEFMHAVENGEDWHLIARTTGEPVGEPIPAPEPPRKILPSLVFQARIDSMSSSTERMKHAEH